MSWRAQITRDGGTLPEPPVTRRYLLDALLDMGICQSSAAGMSIVLSALSAQEVNAWQQGSGQRFNPWEFQVIREASRAYVAEYYAEADEPPWGDPDAIYNAAAVDQRLLSRRR